MARPSATTKLNFPRQRSLQNARLPACATTAVLLFSVFALKLVESGHKLAFVFWVRVYFITVNYYFFIFLYLFCVHDEGVQDAHRMTSESFYVGTMPSLPVTTCAHSHCSPRQRVTPRDNEFGGPSPSPPPENGRKRHPVTNKQLVTIST